MDIMRQSACLVVNPITIHSYGFLFDCTTVGRRAQWVKYLNVKGKVLGKENM